MLNKVRFDENWSKKSWLIKMWRSKRWTKVGWAAGAGISIGIAAAALSVHHSSPQAAATVVPYIIPVNSTSPGFSLSQDRRDPVAVQPDNQQADNQQIERLRTRNRRLEALVTVLRRRAAERQ
jgi:hypothetical protein